MLLPEGELAGEDDQKWTMFTKRVGAIATVLIWWPTWALLLKRLHDLGLGLIALLPFIALDVLLQYLDFHNYDDLSWQFQLLSFGALLMTAVLKGNAGPNQYGPDPLAKAAPPASSPSSR